MKLRSLATLARRSMITAALGASLLPLQATRVAAAAVTIELCAKPGSIQPSGAPGAIPIWGFAPKPTGVDCTDAGVVATTPGPVLRAAEGDAVTVVLHNGLSQPVSLSFPGMGVASDFTGTAPGTTTTYSFTAVHPGTFLYESGVDTARQLPMGLVGAFVIDAATPGQAYADPVSAYDRDAVMVFSEIDEELNADPLGFDLRNYEPDHYLINGASSPDVPLVEFPSATAGLVRVLNAGNRDVSLALIGNRFDVIARDGRLRHRATSTVSELLAAGTTLDARIVIPGDAAPTDRYAFYNRALPLAVGFLGGQFTYVAPGPLCGGRLATIVGTDASETIVGTPGDDVIIGLGGNDTLEGGGGADLLCGGAGDDSLIAGPGDELFDGGPGSDTANYSAAVAGVTVDLVAGSASGGSGNDAVTGIENIIGTPATDVLIGDLAANRLAGRAGPDVLVGNGGADVLDGGFGNDTADYSSWWVPISATTSLFLNVGVADDEGGAANDTLVALENVIGTNGADIIVGTAAANVLSGLGGDDSLFGLDGDDVIDGGDGSDFIDGGIGNDTCMAGEAVTACP